MLEIGCLKFYLWWINTAMAICSQLSYCYCNIRRKWVVTFVEHCGECGHRLETYFQFWIIVPIKCIPVMVTESGSRTGKMHSKCFKCSVVCRLKPPIYQNPYVYYMRRPLLNISFVCMYIFVCMLTAKTPPAISGQSRRDFVQSGIPKG